MCLGTCAGLALALVGGGATAQVADFRLGQAAQGDGDRIHAYLDVWDEQRLPVEELDASSLEATWGGEGLSVLDVEPFRAAGEGVAYVFAVDISRSLDAEAWGGIRRALDAWITGLGPNDRAAVLAFGDESRVVADYTSDRAALRTAVESLGPTDGTTVLYRALVDALELSARRDPDLPRRRGIVVLSDGLDEGSGLVAEDVLVGLRESRLPLYSVGFGGPRRQESLDLLLRLSTNSGGRFVAVEGADFERAYAEMREAIERVWVARFACAGCRLDGASRRLQVNLRQGERILSKGIELRLLAPVGSTAPRPAPPGPPESTAPAQAEASAELGSARWPRAWLLAGGAGVAALALLGWVLLHRRDAPGKPKPVRKKMSRRERRLNEVPLDSVPLSPEVALRLVVVRGSQKGREYRFLLRDSARIGSGRRCEFCLDDEPGVDPEQLELRQDAGSVRLRNLARRRPTLLNGARMTDDAELSNGDLVGTGDFIARVVLG